MAPVYWKDTEYLIKDVNRQNDMSKAVLSLLWKIVSFLVGMCPRIMRATRQEAYKNVHGSFVHYSPKGSCSINSPYNTSP